MKFIVVENALDCWEDPLVQSLFTQMVELRRQAFGKYYEAKVLPFDSTDYISDLVFLVEESENSQVEVLGTYKVTSSSVLTPYALTNPYENLLRTMRPEDLANKYLELYHSKQQSSDAYFSCLSTAPRARGKSEFAMQVKKLIITSTRWYLQSNQEEYGLIVGMEHVKTIDKLLEIGFAPIENLQILESPRYSNQRAQPLMLERSKLSNDQIIPGSWNERRIISRQSEQKRSAS